MAGYTNEGVHYDVDAMTVTRKGDSVQSWVRETLPRSQRDANGKSYVVSFTERLDDCANRRFALGAIIRRDAKGAVVGNGSAAAGWQEIVPSSIAESLSRTVCAVAFPPKEQAFVTNATEGQWTLLGPSADKKFQLFLRTDRILKTEGVVLAETRSDYAQTEWMAGLPIRHVVTASAIDCAKEQYATLGSDFYVAPGARVKAVRNDGAKLAFQPIAAGSFLHNSLPQICSSAVALQPKAPPASKPDVSIGFGTAWGVTKGYLVTAHHVIDGAGSILIYRDGEKIGAAKVVADDPANDIAVLKMTTSAPVLVVLPLATHSPALGRSVFTLGYPHPVDLGEKVKMTAGQVSSTAGPGDDPRFLQISVPVQAGNSGGPLIESDGSVVGVIDLKLVQFPEHGSRETDQPQMVNYAVKVSYVRPMLEDLPDLGNYELIKVSAKSGDLVAATQRAVFMVVVTP